MTPLKPSPRELSCPGICCRGSSGWAWSAGERSNAHHSTDPRGIMAKLSLLGKNRVIYEWVGAYILLSIATSSHRKKRLFWPSCGEGGERAWQGSPHHFQEEEKASDPQFYHQCSAGQGSSSSVPAKSGVGEEAAPRAVNKTLRVSLGLSC